MAEKREVVETEIKGASKTRPSKPGTTRVMVSLKDEHYAKLEQLAEAESPVFPRAINEYLSILIAKRFDTHLIAGLDAPVQGSLLP